MKEYPGLYFVPTDDELNNKLRESPRPPENQGSDSKIPLHEALANKYQFLFEKYTLKNRERSNAEYDVSPFHIQHQSHPKLILKILSLWDSTGKVNTAQICEATKLSQRSLRATILPFIRQIGVLTVDKTVPGAFVFTSWSLPLRVLSVRSLGLLAEAMHVQLITRWRVNPAMRASWAYAVTAGYLWERSPVDLGLPFRQRLVTAVREAGAEAYGIPIEKVAFSTNSLAGALHWLGALDPPAVAVGASAKREVRRRQTCPEAAVWWAIGALNASEEWGGAPGTWLALDDAREELLARVLFLDQLAVPAMLDRAAAASESLSGGPCLRFDASRRAVEIVRTLPVGTFPGLTDQVNGQ